MCLDVIDMLERPRRKYEVVRSCINCISVGMHVREGRTVYSVRRRGPYSSAAGNDLFQDLA